MNQKTLAIMVIAVVVVAVIAVGAYWALTSGGTNGDGDNGGDGNGGTTTGVADATSLSFKIDITGGDAEGTYEYMAKNIGTSEMMIRIEIPLGEMDFIYIVNGAQQKAWADEGTGWVDLSDAFATQWDMWGTTWEAYTDNLSTWTGGDWTYTDPDGATVKIYDIAVNTALSDSLFEP